MGFVWEWIRRFLEMLGIRIPSMRIRPTSGPSGTNVIITLSGMQAGEPIGIVIGPGTQGTAADARGRATIREIVHGEPGTTVEIVAVIGANPAVERRLRATFRVTE